MFLQSLKILNIRTFKDADVNFGKINFITGKNLDTNDGNGVGKSALIQSILLLIGGSKLSDLNLSKFIRNNEKEAILEGSIETSSGDLLEIKRVLKSKGSGSLTVKINNQDLNLTTSSQYQDVIFENIGFSDDFKKFRIIDNSSGINILDFSSGQLRKTLMNLCQDKFDNIRKKLLEKKNEFEKYSMAHIIVKHAPSIKRLKIIEGAIYLIGTTELTNINKELNEYQKEKNDLSRNAGYYKQERDSSKQAYQKLQNMNQCYACYQNVPEQHKQKHFERFNKVIKESQEKLTEVLSKIEIYNDLILTKSKKQSEICRKKEKLSQLKYQLETRLKQSNYKYTLKDIELAKSAIEEIDNFANYYIVEWVNTIEPIVNTYLEVLNMKFSFNINEKGNLNPKIKRDDDELDYEQLSQGEKIFVSFIFKIALLLENNNSGLIIADEGLSALSTENLNRIITLASNLPIQLIAVTHNVDVDMSKTNVINIEKQKGVSKII